MYVIACLIQFVLTTHRRYIRRYNPPLLLLRVPSARPISTNPAHSPSQLSPTIPPVNPLSVSPSVIMPATHTASTRPQSVVTKSNTKQLAKPHSNVKKQSKRPAKKTRAPKSAAKPVSKRVRRKVQNTVADSTRDRLPSEPPVRVLPTNSSHAMPESFFLFTLEHDDCDALFDPCDTSFCTDDGTDDQLDDRLHHSLSNDFANWIGDTSSLCIV